MTNEQLYLAIGIPAAINAVFFGILMAYINAKIDGCNSRIDGCSSRIDGFSSRIDSLRSEMSTGFAAVNQRFNDVNKRFDDMRDLWRAELHRVEEVLDARLKHLEER